MIKIFVDTDSDVTPEEAKKYNFGLISMPFMIGEETTYPFKDGDTFDYEGFYATLKKGVIPKTAALSPVEYIEYFEPEFEKGNDVFYLHFSGAMSGTFNSMRIALEELQEKYPERKFYELDAKGISVNAYLAVRELERMLDAGKSVPELIPELKEEIEHFATYFYADDLKFFAKSGRVSGFTAFMGGIIGIHPIINMNQEGIMGSVDKARGEKQTLLKVIQYVKDLGVDVEHQEIVIAHSDALERVETVKKMLQNTFGEGLKIKVIWVNPTAGSHCGPNNLGVAFYGTHR